MDIDYEIPQQKTAITSLRLPSNRTKISSVDSITIFAHKQDPGINLSKTVDYSKRPSAPGTFSGKNALPPTHARANEDIGKLLVYIRSSGGGAEGARQ